MDTQLLCTFCTEDSLQVTLEDIVQSYEIAFDSIYILENTEDGSLCLTYNIYDTYSINPPPMTISLHRKKKTNTLYTINALNLLIEELNDGEWDRNFQVPWEDYQNCLLVTAYGDLKIINSNLREIKSTEDIL